MIKEMPDHSVPDYDHVVRYVKGTWIKENGTVDGSAFRLDENKVGLSVHWLEFFQGLDKLQQLDKVRSTIRLKLKPSGRFAELSVGRTKKHVSKEHKGVRFLHRPSAATKTQLADPAHSEIMNLPPFQSPLELSNKQPLSMIIGDMIAERVEATHLACGD